MIHKNIFSIFPKQENFFAYLHQCSEILIEICQEIKKLYNNPTEEVFNKIIDLEHKADNLVYEYRHKLNEVFITPLDREDLHQLIIQLDNIIDFAKSSAEKYFLYKPKNRYDFIDQMLDILTTSSGKVRELINIIKSQSKEIIKLVNEICELEKQADAVNRRGIAKLFEDGNDILETIKVKEILSQLEETIDRTQMFAITIENSIFKHI
ncbi:MAG: DUF47 family protein [Candidatus Calescibacterium sp.]|nr:DUF47 family protein [Candidatus Calescibacterium sp.]MCX7971864.1 DUF47 family protein [bacterium]MDW8195037.1 DUF47 family protein [Candidatus Calescibacterium sp.]